MTMNHPIHRLPPELVAHIFVHSLPDTKHPHQNEAPLSVSSVCRAWRRIAISTPRIWSSICIVFLKGKMPYTYPPILKTWISRSCNHGFSFTVEYNPTSYIPGTFDYDLAEIGSTIDVLVQNHATWRNISVSAPTQVANLTSQLLSVIPARIQQISVHTSKFPLDKLFASPLIHLTHLSFSSSTEFTPFRTHTLMEKLTSLSLSVGIFEVMEVLSRAPRLQQAKSMLHLDAGETYSIEPITLPYLHTLDLAVSSTSHSAEDDAMEADLQFRRFLTYLHFPAIKTLFIRFDIPGYTTSNNALHWTGVADLLSRSGATLQNLEVRGASIASFSQFLEALPSLKHFSITEALLREHIQLISGLIHDPYASPGGHSQLCPNLESLRITCRDHLLTSAVIDICSIIVASVLGGPISGRSLVLVVPTQIQGSLSLPSSSRLELVGDDDWVARRRHDLYEEIGANWRKVEHHLDKLAV
ncbi:hypothetical protein BD410DRAFT_827768 [Rickenella mellea]|uniref:F-box domain-containing protein n=1 Tax=Rickenella mellea TaxID=50990 RepID=A0A4Y7Q743_9AGAM|nr:hypothetical protein BD410DRAFT_827768 [Rickenella mellea]